MQISYSITSCLLLKKLQKNTASAQLRSLKVNCIQRKRHQGTVKKSKSCRMLMSRFLSLLYDPCDLLSQGCLRISSAIGYTITYLHNIYFQ